MVTTERSRTVDLSRFFTGENSKLLQGKTPGQISLLEEVANLRLKVQNREIPLQGITLGKDVLDVARTLEKELGVLHKAIPIMDMRLQVPRSALGVDSELRLGEVTNA